MTEYPQWAKGLVDDIWGDEARVAATRIIYFADFGDCIKIGKAISIKARLIQLRPYDLKASRAT